MHLFVSGNIAPHLPNPARPIHQLPEDEFLSELRRLNGMPRAVLESAELLEIVLPAVRSDFALLETYHYEPESPFAFPITAFGGVHDPRTTPDGMEEWRRHTAGAFELNMMTGDHFFVESRRSAVLEHVSKRLAC